MQCSPHPLLITPAASSHKPLLVLVPRSRGSRNIDKYSHSTSLSDDHLFSLVFLVRILNTSEYYSGNPVQPAGFLTFLLFWGRFRVRLTQDHCPKGSARTKTQLLTVLSHRVGEEEDAGKIQVSQITKKGGN